jgi:hypothetical protein
MNPTINYEIVETKPVYNLKDINSCEIIYGNKHFLLDIADILKIINFDKKFKFYSVDDVYPSYKINYRQVNYLEFIYELNNEKNTFSFINNDFNDLRRSNVIITPKININTYVDVTRNANIKTDIDTIENSIMEKYKIIKKINNGHHTNMGREANKIKNPVWKVINDNGEELLLMYCSTNSLCILCEESYKRILEFEKKHNEGRKITFYKNVGGYISSSLNLYIHQIIMDCRGNGKGTKNISVDHLDRNPLNNTLTNLKIATREEQEQNTRGIASDTKRARKQNAQDLPEGLTQDLMRKYVVYYNECYNKEKDLYREFFKVEKHPKLDKPWISSKSAKISRADKLASTNKVVVDLEKDIYPESKETGLPTFVTIKIERNKPHMIFDKKSDGETKRFNLRMVLPENYALEEQLGILKEKIKEKYDLELEHLQ